MRVVCVSDTHNHLADVKVPDGDILIHAGDGTMMGRPGEIAKWGADLRALPHKYIVVIAGNHDFMLDTHRDAAIPLLCGTDGIFDNRIIYLDHRKVELNVDGRLVKIFGSPWTPWFHDWAFNGPEGANGPNFMRQKWLEIPADLDILVTHGPPHGVLDKTRHGQNVGCWQLKEAVMEKMPKLHVFGHIHEAHGTQQVFSTGADRKPLTPHFVNAAIMDVHYDATNAPIVVDL